MIKMFVQTYLIDKMTYWILAFLLLAFVSTLLLTTIHP